MRYAALNTGSEFHGLDHIAPLAYFLQMPLIVTDELNYNLAKKYYPQVESRWMPDLEFRLGELAEQFDALFECKYFAPHLKNLFRKLYNKEMRLVFCPHGQSDKGFKAPLLAPYATQDIVLLYGDLMIEMLKKLNVWSSLSHSIVVGNYRLLFYKKYRTFYDEMIGSEIPFNKNNRTLLYAPTWNDADRSTSFFEFGSKVIQDLPSSWNLILKLHPLLEQRSPSLFYSCQALMEKRPNVFVISECPLIYPILALADVYLGDASSVGYDFLFFKKPMYFFPTDQRGNLSRAGETIDVSCDLYSQLDCVNRYEETQRELYRFAFGDEISEKTLVDRLIMGVS